MSAPVLEAPSAEWIPLRLYPRESRLQVDWCHLRGLRLTDPFFDQTMERCLRHPYSLLFRQHTPVEALAGLQGLPVRGLIFHLSRCGSTLVAQMLAALRRNVVLAEAGPIDSVLRAHLHVPEVTEQQRVEWLRGVVAALGRQRHPEEQHLFLKLDVGHVLELPLIERAFPGVPWIFLYRDPVEIMASHLKRRGAHMVPGALEPTLVGVAQEALGAHALEEYGARVLGALCQAALRAWQQRKNPALLVHYRQLPEVMYTALPRHFRLELSARELEPLREVAQRDAKNPVLPLSEQAREQVERWARPHYEALEAVRQGH
jgi:hypothetical protein